MHLRILSIQQRVLLVGTQESRIVSHLQRTLTNGRQRGLEKNQFPAHVLDHTLGSIQRRA